ncbi:putative transferase, protein kinase RLK-Pelle-RLCK-VIIa-2 family [Rosa chinensis]|uniref:non-specific serine/threonine protein kinase n=1 Tax=Rosa chinensis TaxID=74649 RepID=A0A2P6RN78_ROSCH|nr:putative transferase, protein kinase RLK-Pelle-RLCK-VIIa-2 family [Rosa chinensis]
MTVASLEGRVEAAFLALFGIVLEVKDKNVMYRPLMGSIKSSLDCLKPLIEDMAQGNRVLDRPVKELEYFRMHMEKGAELVRKCSKNGVCAKYKKKKYTNQLLELDACLQRQFNVLRAQVARDVRETTASIKSIQKVIKRIEESGVMKNQMEMNGPCEVVEASSPDEQNEGLVEPSSPDEQNKGVGKMEASDIRVEGSGEVQEKSEVPNCFEVPEPPLFTVGLDVALKEMKMKLLEDGFTKIVVWGVGGVGKTTLVKMLCHDQEVKDKFKKIFFTTASKWQNLNLIMQELYRVLCSQIPTFQNKEGRRYLVVLDDVGDGSESILPEFDGLKIPNSKILITSRYPFPGVGSQYHLKSLNDEDAMSLFHHSASLGDQCSYIPEDLLRKIVECCKGLPLAITVNGRSLCGQPIEIWQKRIVEWGRGSSIFDTEPEMIVCLQRSLDALHREKTIIKECFVDLASFPEDQVIPAAALIDMWAELYGLDEEYWSIANLQKLTIRGFANIVSREEEMEVDGYYSDLFVTLHHMLRGLAIHKASEDTIEQRNRLIIDIHGDNLPSWWTEQKYQPRNARLLSVSTDRAFSRKWHYMQVPKVEVLVLNFQTEKYELPDFLDKIDKLKVLVVTNYGSSSAQLSNFQLVGSLRNLKRIRLEGVSITSITKNPIQLDSLKKIAFTKCDMGQAFGNSSFQFSIAFPNLVEMYVEHCHDLKELPADLGNLSHLETLSISNCHRLSTLPEGIGNLSKLKRLRVRYGTNFVKFPGSIRKLNSLEFLDISGCIKIMGFPEDIGEMSRLRKLNISGCSRLKELPLSVLSLEQLQEVIMDEETEKSWNPFLLKNIDTRVVPPLTVGFDVALEELNCQVLKDRMSRRVECGIAQNKIQTEGWCPVPVPSSLTMGLDVLNVWGAMKMDEKLTSEVRVKQIEGSDVVKKQLGIKGISGNHSRNNIVSNASSSAGGSQLLKAAETDESQTDEQSLETFVLRRFNFEELNVATGNFRSDGIIGRGPFGNIFKGWVDEKTLAPSKVGFGMPVAVKKLNPERVLDFEEWQSELNFRGRTSHPNLVKLLGYCREEKEMLFVYDFMPNGSLEDHFHRRSPGIETLPWNYRLDAAFGMEPLSWNKRLDIASGVAQALAYLHTFSPNQIVHSDLKASNILLDRNYNAKLSNFGLERLGKTGELSHQSTRFVGTSPYIDPKEITTGHSYVKSDVYRFGVTLLQLLTGLKTTDRNRPSERQNLGLKTTDRNCPSERQNLVEWGKPLLLNERNLKTIMDVRIEGQYSSKAAFQVAQLTLKCLALDPKSRPSTTEVVEELEQIQAIEERTLNTSMPSSECRRNIDSNTSSGGGTSVFSEGKTSTFQSKDDDQSIDGHISETSNLRVFSFAELKTATRNFRADTMLGEGGFGIVFKGWLDETSVSPSKAGTGMMIAIKKLKAESFQGFKEWQAEVNFVGRLSHPNLVKLLGYCWEDKELLLVYEFMSRGSLENHLFRRNPNFEPLCWEKRIKIAIGAARGLAFLHSLEKQVIYRDFKTSNILLDGNYNAKLSDFGLAKLGPTGGDSHVSTRIMGTYGYAAPEYIATGHLYVKSDVYSFGVVLLELLTGLRALDTKRPKEQLNLVSWANRLLSNKRYLKTIIDGQMEGQYSFKAASKAGQITLKCLAPDPKNRPSMKEVVEELEQIQAIEEKLTATDSSNSHLGMVS